MSEAASTQSTRHMQSDEELARLDANDAVAARAARVQPVVATRDHLRLQLCLRLVTLPGLRPQLRQADCAVACAVAPVDPTRVHERIPEMNELQI